jgi:hypothetical protein
VLVIGEKVEVYKYDLRIEEIIKTHNEQPWVLTYLNIVACQKVPIKKGNQ